MTARYGIDTSVLVRLLTGDPPAGFAGTVRALTVLVADDAEIVASSQVIGEAYIAVQHHYGVSKAEARAALLSVLQSGLVAPQNGAAVIVALESPTGCGLVDRLIADHYRRADLVTLTLDRRMATLPDVRRI
jgi:predicted nucleic acid-binding protein